MKILVKFPTRSRPKKAYECLRRCAEHAVGEPNYLISIDTDDDTMDKQWVNDSVDKLDITAVVVEKYSANKIDAVNRDISLCNRWDILVLLSDDMMCEKPGWDARIIKDMQKHFPDTDGVLWYNDGYTADNLNTMCILGRAYYDRFGYIYHPDYDSLWCDNEFTEVAQKLDKIVYSPDVLFRHDHFANNDQVERDQLYNHNESFYSKDKETYNRRKAEGFPV